MSLALFAADRFTNPDPFFTPLRSDVAARLTDLARRHWPELEVTGVDAVGDVPPDAGTLANSHNFRVSGPFRTALLKRITRPDVLSVADAQMALMVHCAANGGSVARPLPTAGRAPLAHERGQAWCLLEFGEGRYFQGVGDELELSGGAIGRLHRLLAEAPRYLMPDRVRPAYFTDEERAGLDELRRRRAEWPRLFGGAVARDLASDWDLVESAWARLSADPRLAQAAVVPVHFDLHPHNLLIGGGRCLILDFDSVVRAPLPMAVGYAVVKLLKRAEMARRATGASGPTPGEARRRFLEALSQASGPLPSVSDLRVYARAEILRRFLSVCRFMLKGQAIVWNGPLVHLAALAEVDVLFDAQT